jgi:hypothetical protein
MSAVDDAWQAVVLRLQRAGLDQDETGESLEPDDPRNRLVYVGMDIDAVEVDHFLAKLVSTFHAIMGERIAEGEDPKGAVISAMKGLSTQALMVGWELAQREPG